MNQSKWNISLVIYRQKTNEKGYFQPFRLEVDPDEYVLDAVERVWAFHDRSLTFRHACHHSTCGACGMVVNGVEKLTCITTIRSVTHDGGTLKIQPLRNFPVVSDLVVDMSRFYTRLEQAHFGQVAALKNADLAYEKPRYRPQEAEAERLVDCLECGMCISACPAALTSGDYVGPAILAAIQHTYLQTRDPELLDYADSQNGAWRCHSAFECTAVCPSNVDPGWRIMDLRKRVVGNRVAKLFGKNKEKAAK